jgi:hypothetical protein
MKHRILAIILLLQAAALLSAAPTRNSAIFGTILGTNGRPLTGAEIRIQAQGTTSNPLKYTTDAKGYYAANPIPVGTYRVTVASEGVTLFSADKIKTRAGDGTRVDFDLGKKYFTLSTISSKVTKRFVWIDMGTGSNVAGHWQEVDSTGKAEPDMNNVETLSPLFIQDLQRRQTNGTLR